MLQKNYLFPIFTAVTVMKKIIKYIHVKSLQNYRLVIELILFKNLSYALIV